MRGRGIGWQGASETPVRALAAGRWEDRQSALSSLCYLALSEGFLRCNYTIKGTLCVMHVIRCGNACRVLRTVPDP